MWIVHLISDTEAIFSTLCETGGFQGDAEGLTVNALVSSHEMMSELLNGEFYIKKDYNLEGYNSGGEYDVSILIR
jgi:hypothetical protein